MTSGQTLRTAVLIPCYNESASIASVVHTFRESLPGAEVYVYDNNSTDDSAALARDAGATVRREVQQGKGHVVRRMFADVEADIYVLVDGDGTYNAASAPLLINLLLDNQLDMVTATRVETESDAYRTGHRLGNAILTRIVGLVFGHRVSDMLSGYRVFSRRFVKSFPALSTGFEIETELTVHALGLHLPIDEIDTPYRARPFDSPSKLRTLSDGARILATIALLVRDERPLPFFSAVFAFLALVSVGLATPVLIEFMETGLVPRFPTAILATGLMLLAFVSLTSGFILNTVTLGRREMKRLFYLAVLGPPGRNE
ncbi:RfbJ protein [Thioalkalivibrio nitratireducens DSM 14787]|uniref:RfbJ protein n=1 Tax=Thioalkalivibrio nitratireducens (strain DSM 14787 / UNIQEM 213 / ALEN2) TaxID=1255043 RepID=L0DRZ0_THIND|nr:glycosyltransferase [Thioalkalivibrio nitratireducens]AGA31760.1 RfbJ protein [Thioalkalivibrio nitratireducens DSM 14787]